MHEHPGARMIVTAVMAVVLLVVFVIPAVFAGQGMSSLDLLTLAGGILVIGLLLRAEASGKRRRLGFILVIIGAVSLLGVVGLMWLMSQGLGRPY